MQPYKNLFPNQRSTAIINRSQLGFQSFRLAKKATPLQRLVYKKFTRIQDPVTVNKKFYRINSHLKEFAKHQPLAKEHEVDFLINNKSGGQ